EEPPSCPTPLRSSSCSRGPPFCPLKKIITLLLSSQPIPTKRKAKMRPEVSAKVPHDVRQRYVNLFVEEFLKTSVTVQDAFEKALAEEKTVYDRSINKLKYLSVAVNALKRLKNQSSVSLSYSFSAEGDVALYDSLKEHILSEEILMENNYPLQHPEKSGSAILYREDYKKGITDPLKRICCRCGATYSVNQVGKHTRKEECNYHYGKGVEKKVPGGVETRYSCCEGVAGCPGCQVFKLHVHDAVSLDGFVSTLPRPGSDKGCPGVFSVDCEMCYTTQGLELARVTVVNSSLQVIYDTFVKPDNDVIDYNTRFSGINEADVKGTSSSIRDVQETLLSFVNAETILIGYGLESDLCALKLLHGTVVDTSVSFPHRLGLPHKMTLHNLTADYLRRIIQESVGGHDSAEDAAACMELMLWKVKEDGKTKRW
uniref:Exonuclease domain-containing protein n=1 Tax=Oncorhynchus kisutch TaxID=8019 RepID=A0A8C7GQ23_ONCKI